MAAAVAAAVSGERSAGETQIRDRVVPLIQAVIQAACHESGFHPGVRRRWRRLRPARCTRSRPAVVTCHAGPSRRADPSRPRAGVDFNNDEPPTITRRIERRIATIGSARLTAGMLRRIAAWCAVVAVLAMGLTAASPTRSGGDETASVGAPGATVSPSPFSARRPRTRLASTSGSPDRAPGVGPSWPLWLACRVPSLAPESFERRVALVSASHPDGRAAATPRTSRGPPPSATL